MTVIDKRGLYVHVPFCKRKCNYCDFCSSAESDEVIEKYVQTLLCEIASHKDLELCIDTVFVGGGTPSILSCEQCESIFKAIRKSFLLAPDAEITLEMNPGTVGREKLLAYKRVGINRISIGLQSIHENELKILGRIHSYDDFLNTYSMLRELGFSNISVDLMYGIPEQTRESFAKTLAAVLALQPEHISAYGLIIEEGTPFFKMQNELALPSEDEECDMYFECAEAMRRNGYIHYEISNYAKAGYACRHNLKYWRDEEYAAVGIAAHSYLFGNRFAATESMEEYFDSYGVKYKKQLSSGGKDATEYVMLALRLGEGLSLSSYRELFGKDFVSGKEDEISNFVRTGYLSLNDDRIMLTEKGFYVSNYVISSLI